MSDLVASAGAGQGADVPGQSVQLTGGADSEALVEEQLVSLWALLGLSRVMAQSLDEGEILGLAWGAVARLSRCRPWAGYLRRDGRWVRWRPGDGLIPAAPQAPPEVAGCDIDALVEGLGGQAGQLRCGAAPWVWAYPLSGPDTVCGYLVVGAQAVPTEQQRSLLGALAQEAGAALVGAGRYREQREENDRLRAGTAQLAAANEKLTTTNQELTSSNQGLAGATMALAARGEQLEDALAELRGQAVGYDVLTQALASGQGEAGIAAALHGLTGLAVAVEDPFGNLRAWAGPDPPERYPKARAADRAALLDRVHRRGAPLRAGDRLLALARSHGEVLGVLALIDPARRADRRQRHALEQASTELSIELAHQRDLARTELRLRRDLVEDLIAGRDEPSVYRRAAVLGHDLHRPQRVLTLATCDRALDAAMIRGVDRAMAGLQMPALVTTRGATVILIAYRPAVVVCPPQLHREIRREMGPVAIGVGGPAEGPAQVPRSYTEACRALRIRQRCDAPDGLSLHDQLGLYRVLAAADPGRTELDEFLRDQLGVLLDYDRTHSTTLVKTLAAYLDHGGNYNNTARALVIHRSTLRYRLQRIRDLSGHDLSAVDTRLNLHLATRAWALFHEPP